jgi:isopentenyl-diphosphate delta-isomerase
MARHKGVTTIDAKCAAAPVGAAPIELVDRAGHPVGTAAKLAAHRFPGSLHRAFSVFLFDAGGRMLLQRRASGKYHSPGVWSNSCCGHPLPGEPPALAAARRVAEELGAQPVDLTEAGTTVYRLADPLSGLVEHEYNHTFVGRITTPPRPDPDEVGGLAMVTAAELRRMRAAEPFSVWFEAVARVAMAGVPAWLDEADGWSAAAVSTTAAEPQ